MTAATINCTVNAQGNLSAGHTSTLPVRMESFSSSLKEDHVYLYWLAIEEQTVDHYEMESGTDGQFFTKIGSKKTVTDHNYNFVHSTPALGINYYRIKTIDRDGTVGYSNTLKINVGIGNNVSVYPNPVTDNVNITVTSGTTSKTANINIISMEGRQLMQKNMKATGQAETFNLSKLPAGKYIVQVVVAGEAINKIIEVLQ